MAATKPKQPGRKKGWLMTNEPLHLPMYEPVSSQETAKAEVGYTFVTKMPDTATKQAKIIGASQPRLAATGTRSAEVAPCENNRADTQKKANANRPGY